MKKIKIKTTYKYFFCDEEIFLKWVIVEKYILYLKYKHCLMDRSGVVHKLNC